MADIKISYKYKQCGNWHDGSEVVDETIVKKRVKELGVIVGDDGKKKYKDIKLNGYSTTYDGLHQKGF
jgi:hypothetical protein